MASYSIAPEDHGDRKLNVVRFVGQADLESIRALLRDLTALAASREHVFVLMDESELGAGLVLPQDLRGFIDQWRATIARTGMRIAVFAPNPLIYGLNRMAAWMAAREAEGRLAVFRTRDDAVAWLLAR